MPPQPIERVKSGAHYRLHFDSLDERSHVAQAIAECVLKWSRVEVDMGYILFSLLRANEQQGSALYSSYESGKAKRDALEALSLSSLDVKGAKLVQALVLVVKSHQKLSDKIAHWIWGVSDDLPDHLVLVDPKKAWATAGLNRERLRNQVEEKAKEPFFIRPLTRDDVYVYSRESLITDAASFESLAILATRFTQLVSADQKSRTYAELCTELIQDARLAEYKDRLRW